MRVRPFYRLALVSAAVFALLLTDASNAWAKGVSCRRYLKGMSAQAIAKKQGMTMLTHGTTLEYAREILLSGFLKGGTSKFLASTRPKPQIFFGATFDKIPVSARYVDYHAQPGAIFAFSLSLLNEDGYHASTTWNFGKIIAERSKEFSVAAGDLDGLESWAKRIKEKEAANENASNEVVFSRFNDENLPQIDLGHYLLDVWVSREDRLPLIEFLRRSGASDFHGRPWEDVIKSR